MLICTFYFLDASRYIVILCILSLQYYVNSAHSMFPAENVF